jgi:hypothetical protein
MVVGLQLSVQSVPITTKVVSLSPVHGEATGQWFSLVFSTNKTDHHNIVESGIKHHKPETTLDTTV